ncbi:MAG: VCBS domain-containing protein, partial [Pseudomonadota bacterium]
NDVPVISNEATDDRAVKEDSDLNASGTLTIFDVDTGQNEFKAAAGATSYGTFSLGANGAWTYLLTNTNAAVQALAEGVQL